MYIPIGRCGSVFGAGRPRVGALRSGVGALRGDLLPLLREGEAVATYRILMIEDNDAEALAIETLVKRYFRERGDTVTITREIGALDLCPLARRHDLVLLDIELPGVNGMEAAESLREEGIDTPLIFVTNLAQYAVHGYAVDALGFIVKPAAFGSVCLALDKAVRVIGRNRESSVMVKCRDGAQVVACEKIIFIEVRSHELVYHIAGRPEPLTSHGSLTAVEAELPAGRFVRISSSCSANIAHISHVRRESLLMDDGSELWFSRRKKTEALKAITEYLGGIV